MRPARRRKLIILSFSLLSIISVIVLILMALEENINLYYTPTELIKQTSIENTTIKLGGMVKNVHIQQRNHQQHVEFIVTDFVHNINVTYEGILPNLFREGKGVVVQGHYTEGRMIASDVLAKHDENYMPPNVLGIIQHDT